MRELMVMAILTVTALTLSGGMVEFPLQEAQSARSVRKLAGDWHVVPEDGNCKLVVEKNVLKLAPEDDEFGSQLDKEYWEELDGSSVIATWEGKQKAVFIEENGALTCKDGDTSAWALAARRKVAYASADLVFEWSDTGAADRDYGAGVAAFLWRDAGNFVRISYVSRSIAENHRITVAAMVNNTWKTLLDSRSIGLHKKIRLRIKRDAANSIFTCYYAVWDSEKGFWKDWEHAWSGTVDDKEHFSTSHSVYPVVAWRKEGANAENFTPMLNRYYQYELDMPAQRFWPDMPECDIVDSGAGGAEFCLDAGPGKTLKLEGFSAQLHEPGNSSVAFRAAFGDSPRRASAIWIGDGKWLTASQLNEKVASGVLDRHRYAFLRLGLKSDGTVQPSLTSVTFTGTPADTYGACSFDTYFATVDRNEKVIVEDGIAKLAPDGDEFGSIVDSVLWTVEQQTDFCWNEANGVLGVSDGTLGERRLRLLRKISYGECDLELAVTDTNAGTGDADYGVGFYLWMNKNNSVILYYNAHSLAGYQVLVCSKMIDGKGTELTRTSPVNSKKIKLRLRRRISDNRFWFYYATWAGSNWNSWTLLWNGVVNHPGCIDTSTPMRPTIYVYHVPKIGPPRRHEPEFDYYRQCTGEITPQRFLSDSPEVLVIRDSGVNWALDAGEGNSWKLRDAECEKTEPGGSSVKFKVGVSDTGVHYDATWKDEKWQTVEQVCTNAASGAYNGHRYIHVKAQFNSDGTEQPTLRSFRVHGSREPGE